MRKHITEICREIYEKKGFCGVCDYVNEMLERDNPMPDLGYEFCKACDTEAPAWNHICLACGQGTKVSIWGEIRNDFEEDGIIHIDAWVSGYDNEEGKVIAKVNHQTKKVEYLDDRAKTDEYAQEIINETLRQ